MSYYRREEWGAKPPTRRVQFVPAASRDAFFVHHTVHDNPSRHTHCFEIVRAIQQQHRAKWADIGYGELVCPHGAVFEGRGFLAVGAHCEGWNRRAFSVAFIGDGRRKVPAPALLAIRDRYDAACAASGRNLMQFGHGDKNVTACPGGWLLSWVHAGMSRPGHVPQEPRWRVLHVGPDLKEDSVRKVEIEMKVPPDGRAHEVLTDFDYDRVFTIRPIPNDPKNDNYSSMQIRVEWSNWGGHPKVVLTGSPSDRDHYVGLRVWTV